MKKEYSDGEIMEAIDKVLSAAFVIDYMPNTNKRTTCNPNYKSGCPYDEPGELVKRYVKLYPALAFATEKHWERRLL